MINLEQIRSIVGVNMPFDTGFMFLNGTRYDENERYIHVTYDVNSVPYIVFQELGTRFFDGNKGFIGVDTVNEINEVASYQAAGMTQEFGSFNTGAQARSSMISQGSVEHIKRYESGWSNESYTGRTI